MTSFRMRALMILLVCSSVIGQNKRNLAPNEVLGNWSARYMRLYTTNAFSPVVKPPISSIVQSNPAAVTNYELLTVGLSYMLRSPSELIFSNGKLIYRDFRTVPRSFAASFKFEGFHFGIGYNNAYQLKIDDDIEITTLVEPEGTGNSFNILEMTHQDQYSIIIGKKLALSRLNSSLSIGVSVSNNQIFVYRKVWEDEIHASHEVNSGSFGTTFNFKDIFVIGLFYNLGFEELFFKGDDLPAILWDFPGYVYQATQHPQLSAGFLLKISNKLDLDVSIDHSVWEGYQSNEIEVLNYSGVAHFKMNPNILIGFGLLSFNYPEYTNGENLHFNDDFRYRSVYPILSASYSVNEHFNLALSGTGKVFKRDAQYDRDVLSVSLEYTK
ncbi:MAG: hypothetical protein HQ556_05205 [Candidatus Marinimicrobia bacterium]|nr:hypothetical protein [Candidatus Neomarinimicrobiota bacterium]